MFVEARSFPEDHIERARVCIFGSGPAGMTLAYTLAESGVDVLLVEAGGMELEEESQALYQGAVVGDDYFDLEFARLRYFGGTSGHWGGICRPLDPHDFEANPAVPDSGWPIGIESLEPYMEEAAKILEIPARFDDRTLSPTLVRTYFQQSPPVRFGEKYQPYVAASKKLRVVLNTALTNVTAKDGHVRTATVRTMSGGSWSVEADYFVLCAGGIENSRLLLWINEQNNRQVIKNHDLIGRYWMEHFSMTVAEAMIDTGLDGLFYDGQAYFALSGEYQKQKGILNASFDVSAQAYEGSKALIADILCIAPKLGQWVMGEKTLVCGSRIYANWEQAPDPENRVSLGDEKDALGIPKVVLHWRRTDIDRKTIARSTLGIAKQFAELDIGRVRLHDWVDDDDSPFPDNEVMGAWHHMGGTRMSETPETGLVDPDLRLHDLDNFYIGGSSVFPSGGFANPTLTIVQLSLRLADHLRTRIEK